jgi:hypothetical protein
VLLIDVNEVIYSVDIFFSRKPVTSSVPTRQTLEDKWCSVSYCNDPQMIRVTDRCCSYVLDKRV